MILFAAAVFAGRTVPARAAEEPGAEETVTGEEPEHGFSLRIRCGKGTYIRTICDDLGKLCGCPAHMRSLVRTLSGVFRAEDGITLDEARELAAEGKLGERMLPPDYPLGHLRRVDVPARYAKMVAGGAKIPAGFLEKDIDGTENLRVYLDNCFWGIMKKEGDVLIWRAQIAPEEL